MKKILVSAGLAVLLAAFGAARAADFEGSVTYHVTSGDHQSDVTYLIKGSKLRLEIGKGGRTSSSIIDMKTKKITILMHDQKMYMTTTISESDLKAARAKVEGKFVKTGKTETIAGRSCEEWIYTSKEIKSNLWLTKGMGIFAGFMDGKNFSQADWVKAIKSKGLFPLKTVTELKGGKTASMVATDIQEKTLGDDLFVAPKDYKKMDMPKVDVGEAVKKSIPGVKLPF